MSRLILPTKRKADGDVLIDDNKHLEHVDDKDKDKDVVMMLETEEGDSGTVDDDTSMLKDDDDDDDDSKIHLVYLSVRNSEDLYDPLVDWYVLDTHAGTLDIDSNMSGYRLPLEFGCTVLGSKVYTIGGELEPRKISNKMYVYNTTKRDWQVGPEMHASRSLALTVSLGKRIYVFGGTKTFPWAEYYDSISNQWNVLPDPPPSFIRCPYYTSAAVHGEDTIIIWNVYNFCLLDLSCRLSPKWHCIGGPLICGSHDFVTNNTTVVNGIVYWSARDLFAFDLARNIRFAKPAFKFDESETTIAPSIDFLHTSVATMPPILAVTGEDQLSVIWSPKKNKDDKYLKVYCKKFQIQTLDDAEMLAYCTKCKIQTSAYPDKKTRLCKDCDTIEFDIHGNHICQYGAVQWHNDDKGKHNLNLADVKPTIINPMDLLQNLACTMYKENFNSHSRIDRRAVFVEFTDSYIALRKHSSRRLADMSIQDFLKIVGLQKYAKNFEEKNIDMNGLKRMSKEALKDLKIPMGPRSHLFAALRSYLLESQ